MAQQKTEEREREFASIIAGLKEKYPDGWLFRIIIPGHEDELFVARRGSWTEHKALVGTADNPAVAMETLVQKYLVYPTPNYEEIATRWLPGLVIMLSQKISEGLGVVQGGEIKNV